jgi:hypothetical protein
MLRSEHGERRPMTDALLLKMTGPAFGCDQQRGDDRCRKHDQHRRHDEVERSLHDRALRSAESPGRRSAS